MRGGLLFGGKVKIPGLGLRLASSAALFTVSILLFTIAVSPGAHGADFKYGAAIRQNLLLMRSPASTAALYGSRVFGMSETRTRFWTETGALGVRFRADVDSRGSFASGGAAGAFGGGSLFGQSKPSTLWDMTFNHHTGTDMTLTTRIDRMQASFSLKGMNVDVGRQPVSLGTSHFVGILDVIAPFAPGELDATYKPGVDAIRVRRGIGMTSEAEIIAAGADEIEAGALIGRIRTPFRSFDIEIVGGRFRRRGFGGVGWEGGIGDFGIWGEAALFQGKESDWKGEGAAFSVVSGVDYYYSGDTIFGGSLMYQDFGVRDPEDLLAAYASPPFTEGWLFLGSAGYGVITAHHQVHPLVSLDASGLINLVDGSMLLQPVMQISTGDNSDLAFYGWIGAGKGARQVGPMLAPRSEFGMLPGGGGMYGRWFF